MSRDQRLDKIYSRVFNNNLFARRVLTESRTISLGKDNAHTFTDTTRTHSYTKSYTANKILFNITGW